MAQSQEEPFFSELARRLAKRAHGFVENGKTIRDVPLMIGGSAVALLLPTLRRLAEGANPNGSTHRFAVYANYDRNSLIGDYVVEQIAALSRLGYRLIFVSSSPAWIEEQMAKVRPYCWKIILRRNLGHDFASYKAGIRQIGSLDSIERLLLMNDSCYGPLFELDALESLGAANGANFWGVTDSWSGSYHVQSYYLAFDRRAVMSPAFRKFWAFLPPYQTRRLAIRIGEVGLTKCLLRGGLRASVLCPYNIVASAALKSILGRLQGSNAAFLPHERRHLEKLAEAISNGQKLNPMHSFWDILIAEFHCPFIKRNLLRDNPTRIPGLLQWPELISAQTRYPVALIQEHLKVS